MRAERGGLTTNAQNLYEPLAYVRKGALGASRTIRHDYLVLTFLKIHRSYRFKYTKKL